MLNEEINFCAECGAQVSAADRFCPECGAPLQVGVETPVERAPSVGPVAKPPAKDVAPPRAPGSDDAETSVPAPPAADAKFHGGAPHRKRRWLVWTVLAVAVVVGAIAIASSFGYLPPIDWIPSLTTPAPTVQPPASGTYPPPRAQPAPEEVPQKAPPPTSASQTPGPDESFRIAEQYAQGSGGRPKDLSKALEWYARAARQGHAHAAWMLGRLYGFYGATPGVPRDIDRALYWMNAAADKGHTEAEFAMGMFFSDPAHFGDKYAGQRDYTRAIHWLKLAAKANHPIAPSQLAVLYAELARYYADRARLEPSLKERAASHAREAQFWLEEAARRGDQQAQQELRRQGKTW